MSASASASPVPSAPVPARPAGLGAIFLTVFLDLVGFSVIFPLFPAMLTHYLGREGADGWVGALHQTLAGWAGGNPFYVAVLFGGLLSALYSLLQFVCAPLWGRLSDRVGRRPVLLLTTAGLALSHLLWVFADTFGALVAARLLGGVMAGNISVATAAIGDVTTARKRSSGMALIGIAYGVGFLCGPALGAALSHLDWSGGGAGLHPFSACAAGALALSGLNLLWLGTAFRETLPPARRAAPAPAEGRLKALLHEPNPGVRAVNRLYLVYTTAFSGMEFSITFLAFERFAYTPGDNSKIFLFLGFILLLVQGGLVRRLGPKVGERPLAVAGLAASAGSFAALGLAGAEPWFYAGLALLGLGAGLVNPSLSALVSRYTDAQSQGRSLGGYRAAGALGRTLGPLAGAVLYFGGGPLALYLTGAAVTLLPLALALRLPPPPPAPEEDRK